ncbi:MAG: PaaI family thioesterase [Acidobacteriota bacterium]|nr:PaaI family thioesterase [Acidobacteriota bacterium]
MRVRASFARQRAMETVGARLVRVAPGEVEIEVAFRDDLTQQHGYLHAGVAAAVVDSACGYAALSLAEPGAEVLSVEFKLNLLAPSAGDSFVARARVLRPGRNVTVCAGDFYARQGGPEKLVATMLATMMTVRA